MLMILPVDNWLAFNNSLHFDVDITSIIGSWRIGYLLDLAGESATYLISGWLEAPPIYLSKSKVIFMSVGLSKESIEKICSQATMSESPKLPFISILRLEMLSSTRESYQQPHRCKYLSKFSPIAFFAATFCSSVFLANHRGKLKNGGQTSSKNQ